MAAAPVAAAALYSTSSGGYAPAAPPAYAPAAPPAYAPAAAPPAYVAAGGFTDDPFGDAAFAPPPPPPPPAIVLPAAAPTGDLQAWFNALLYKERGILYEDQYLQVGGGGSGYSLVLHSEGSPESCGLELNLEP